VRPCHGHATVHQSVELCSCRYLKLGEFSRSAGNISICWAQPLRGTRQGLEVLLFEMVLYRDVSGEHWELIGAWRSALKSKLVSPFQ
jgi:hypothetical protein